MKNFQTAQPSSRVLKLAALFAFGLWHSTFGITPSAAVAAIQPTRVADLILLDHGFDAGLRQGMVCRVTRGATEIAEVLVVEVRPSCSAALITSLAARQAIRAGDVASVKVLKT